MFSKLEIILILLTGIFIGLLLNLIINRVSAEYKNTESKQGNCIIQERIYKPEYRLHCEEK